MLFRNKFIQVGLLSTAMLVGSLMAIGCSSTAGESTIASATSQSIASIPAQPPAVPSDQPAGTATNQSAATPSNTPAKPMDTPNQKSTVSPSQPGQISNSMAKVAAVLGIDQQKLEDAFTQARTALGDKGLSEPPTGTNMPAPPGGMTRPVGTNLPVPTGTAMLAPFGAPGQAPAGSSQAGMSKELLAKVASILGIDQQKLEDALNQVMKQQ